MTDALQEGPADDSSRAPNAEAIDTAGNVSSEVNQVIDEITDILAGDTTSQEVRNRLKDLRTRLSALERTTDQNLDELFRRMTAVIDPKKVKGTRRFPGVKRGLNGFTADKSRW